MRIILYAVLAGIVANFCWIKPSPVFGETNKSHLEFLSPYKMAANSTGLDHDSIENTGNENQPASISGENHPLKRHFISLFVGADYWPNLGKVDPSQAGFDPQQFGQFKTWGYNLELAYHYLATTWFDRDLWIGLDFGFFFNENKGKTTAVFLPSGETFSGEIGSRGMYLTPSLKWFVWGRRAAPRLYLSAGAGYYLLDFAELYQFGEGAEIYEDSTLGGYLGVGVRLPVSKKNPESFAVVLESKVHFADFDELAPNSGDIKGPIYVFQLGITF